MLAELDIAAEYEALLQFLYLAPVGLVQSSVDGEIAMINPLSAQLLMPLSRDGGLGNLFTVFESVAPDLRHMVSAFEHRYGMVCEALRIQVSAGVRGKTDPQILSFSLLKLDENRLMAVLSDISQQVKRERLLKQNEAWLNAILTGITDYALVNLDGQGRITDWNQSISRVTGLERDAVVNQPYSVFQAPDATTPDHVIDRLREADANGWSLEDCWHVKADGGRFWGSAMIAPLQTRQDEYVAGQLFPEVGPDDPAYCLVIRDITDKFDAGERHRRATSCDFLTGIANRRAFFEAAEFELERWRRSPRPLSLILFDADHFKQVNDRYGHAAGDAVLRHLAGVLSSTFRQVDVVARVGGEEFAVLLPSTGHADAMAIAERMRASLESESVTVDGVEVHYSVSGGVATMDAGVTGLDALIKRADDALYAAKGLGRNRIESWLQPGELG